MQQGTHERLVGERPVTGSSERSFGFVVGGALALLSLLNLWHHGRAWAWMAPCALLLVAAAVLKPSLLKPLNLLWFKLGLLLHRVVSPLVLGLLFYLVVVPTGLLLRLSGKDPLRLRRDPATDTYWIPRQPPGPAPETMRNQF